MQYTTQLWAAARFRCGVRTERIPWLAGKARYTARFEAAVAQESTLEQYPRLRATRLWAMLRDRGYPGSSAVQRE